MKTKLFIYPANNNENQNINIQQKAIKECGINVTYSLKDFFSTDFFLLNWFETLGGNIKLDYIKKCIKIFFMVLFRKKIFWVVHNKQPHTKYSNDRSLSLSIKLMKKLQKVASRIIILCDETEKVLKQIGNDNISYEAKIYKIPHPNYIGIYPEHNTPITEKKLNFLYIGQVNKYKNVDLLINVFNGIIDKNISLTIAGNCKDKMYIEQLNKLVSNKNIFCDFQFIPDNEIISYINKSEILILPYSLDSSLNSGTIFLAFSYKKTVISPLIGTLKEYEKNDSFFYSYEYNTQEEHLVNLKSIINKVIEDYKNDSKILQKKGIEAFNLVQKQNSFEIITTKYKELFSQFKK